MHALSLRRLASSAAALAAAFALAVLTAFAVPSTAFAHDALEGTSPASGASVAAVPTEVRLDFSNRPLGVGVEVKVTDASGQAWSEGAPEVVDRSVRQALRAGAPAGAYTVVWRVVSSDSHPIEGTFTFTAAGSGSTTPAASPAASGSSAAAPAIQTPQPGATATEAPAPAAQSQDFPWLIVVFAVVAVGLLAALGYGARRRLRQGEE